LPAAGPVSTVRPPNCGERGRYHDRLRKLRFERWRPAWVEQQQHRRCGNVGADDVWADVIAYTSRPRCKPAEMISLPHGLDRRRRPAARQPRNFRWRRGAGGAMEFALRSGAP
jgi:hypothetical protein